MCVYIDKTCKNAIINKTRANTLIKSRKAWFELRKLLPQNATYFSIIAMPKKSHFIFAIQNFVSYTKKTHMNSIYIVGIMFVMVFSSLY